MSARTRNVIVHLFSVVGIKKRFLFFRVSPVAEITITGCSYPQVSGSLRSSDKENALGQSFRFNVSENTLLGRNPVVIVTLHSSLNFSKKSLGSCSISLFPNVHKVGQMHYGAYSVIKINGNPQGILNAAVVILGEHFTQEQLDASKISNQVYTGQSGHLTPTPTYGMVYNSVAQAVYHHPAAAVVQTHHIWG